MALAYIPADDKLVDRDRAGRSFVFFGSAISLPILGAILGFGLAWLFLDFPASELIGAIFGALGGWALFLVIRHRYIVQNDTTGALVTLNALRSLFNQGDVNVVYGPGTHFAYPWEQRFERNNIPVMEATNSFKFPVVCLDGILNGEGSFRLRPDFNNPIAFLSGVGSVAGDLEDLIITEAAGFYKQKKVMEATSSQHKLNIRLNRKFAGGVAQTPFEKRFGVQVGDVTIRTVLPSEELQRTISGLAEADMVLEGTAVLLGMTKDQLKKAIADNTIDPAKVDRARRDFRIISGNMDGSKVNRYELDISGVTPEVAQAISAIIDSKIVEKFVGGDKTAPAAKTPKGGGKK